ncbi:hypothetical protein FF1_037912 [Malus domestica]
MLQLGSKCIQDSSFPLLVADWFVDRFWVVLWCRMDGEWYEKVYGECRGVFDGGRVVENFGKEGGRRWSGCDIFWALEWCFWGVLLPRVSMDDFL